MKNELYIPMLYKWAYKYQGSLTIISYISIFLTTAVSVWILMIFIPTFAMSIVGATISSIKRYNKDKKINWKNYNE